MIEIEEPIRPLQGSDLERITGISRSTIHSYIKKGILSEPVRTGKTMAYYSTMHLDELEEIQSLKKAGYPLSNIKTIMDEKRKANSFVSKQAETPNEIRERVLDQATDLFSSRGYRKTEMKDIARESGVSVNTLHLYFEDKQKIFLECAETVLEAMLSDIRAEVVEEQDPLQKLIKTSVLVLKSYPHFLEILDSIDNMVVEYPSFEEKGREIYRRTASIVTDELEQYAESANIQIFVDKMLASYILIGMVKTFRNASLLFNYDISDFVQFALDAIYARQKNTIND